jgi:2-amino-4-hydroxy-6-hydroxymethyldihydropteridine diphosphokinase
MSEWTPVLIAIGSNIERERNVPQAIVALGQQPAIELQAVSPIYESRPVGAATAQPPYYNAAALIETRLAAATLKEILLAIEESQGRMRTADKFAARPIDLDIALFGQHILDMNGRHIPDPDIVTFPHVAVPLANLAPGWVHPELGLRLADIAAGFSDTSKALQKIGNLSLTAGRVTDAGMVASPVPGNRPANGNIAGQFSKGD